MPQKVCPRCQCKKQVMGMGMIDIDCPKCNATGFVEEEKYVPSPIVVASDSPLSFDAIVPLPPCNEKEFENPSEMQGGHLVFDLPTVVPRETQSNCNVSFESPPDAIFKKLNEQSNCKSTTKRRGRPKGGVKCK